MHRVDEAAAQYCAVTLVDGASRRDLLLPASVPSQVLLPGLLRLLRPHDPAAVPGTWSLTPVGRPSMGWEQSLADVGVVHGDVMMLTSSPHMPRESVVEDVRGRIEDVVDRRDARWSVASTGAFLAWLLVAWALLAVPIVAGRIAPSPSGVLTAAALTSGLTVAAVVVERRGLASAGSALLAAACVWAGIGGWQVAAEWPTSTAMGLGPLAAAAASLALAVPSGVVIPQARTHAAACAVLAVAGTVVACTSLTGAAPLTAARVCGIAAVLCCAGASNVALALGGVIAEDQRARPFAARPLSEVDRRIDRADGILVGLLAGIGLVVAICAVQLAGSADRWDGLLGVGIGGALVLRARTFSRVRHLLPLLTGGALALGAAWLSLYQRSGPWQLLLAVAVGVLLVAVVASVQWVPALSAPMRARMTRFVDAAEMVLAVLVVLLAAGGFGLYAWVGAAAT